MEKCDFLNITSSARVKFFPSYCFDGLLNWFSLLWIGCGFILRNLAFSYGGGFFHTGDFKMVIFPTCGQYATRIPKK